MLLDDPPPGVPGVGPFADVCRRRIHNAPVIEDVGNMPDSFWPGLTRAPKHEVVVVTAVEVRTKAADFLDQAAPIDSQVAKPIARQHERRVPVRLEPRLVSLTTAVDLVLVGKYQVGVG